MASASAQLSSEVKQPSTSRVAQSTVVALLGAAIGLAYLVSITFGLITERLGLAEVLLFVVVLFFGTGLVSRVEEFGFTGTSLSVKLHRVEAQQATQGSEIADLRFLVSHFLTLHEADHLRKLANPAPFPYEGYRHGSPFQAELDRLRRLGFVQPLAQVRMRHLPESDGDLHKYLVVTDPGHRYLAMRDRAATDSPNGLA